MNEAEYTAQVDAWIRAACKEGSQTFANLLRALPGVDPAFVQRRVDALGLAERKRVLWQPVEDCTPILDLGLPVPHPLDFDWRFHPQTIDELCAEVGNQRELTILLGAPSLLFGLAKTPKRGSVLLLDQNPALVAHLTQNPALTAQFSTATSSYEVRTVNLFRSALESRRAGCVVADPPWYPEATKAFLRTAAEFSRTGGVVLLSVAPLGTRPGMKAERDELLSYAERCGLFLREERLASLRYVMPPFERNTLRVARLLPFVPVDWRRGDLLVFEQRSRGELPPHQASPRDEASHWQEHIIDGVRIRVQTGVSEDEGEDPRLLSLLPGDILPSVSRRDSRRAAARVWTSGNRIFGCHAPKLLHQLLAANVNALEGAFRDALSAIKELVQIERKEYICADPNEQAPLDVDAAPPNG